MKIKPPFIISLRLLPAVAIGDSTLSLDLDGSHSSDGRDIAEFTIDFADGTSYTDRELESGCGGFLSHVEAFESFLGFMGACIESLEYSRYDGEGENADLFPRHIGLWAVDHKHEIEEVMYQLTNEKGMVHHDLIVC